MRLHRQRQRRGDEMEAWLSPLRRQPVKDLGLGLGLGLGLSLGLGQKQRRCSGIVAWLPPGLRFRSKP